MENDLTVNQKKAKERAEVVKASTPPELLTLAVRFQSLLCWRLLSKPVGLERLDLYANKRVLEYNPFNARFEKVLLHDLEILVHSRPRVCLDQVILKLLHQLNSDHTERDHLAELLQLVDNRIVLLVSVVGDLRLLKRQLVSHELDQVELVAWVGELLPECRGGQVLPFEAVL